MLIEPCDPKSSVYGCSYDLSQSPEPVHTTSKTFAAIDGVRHIRFDQRCLEVVVRPFWPVQFALNGVKFIQKESATIYSKLPHHEEKAVQVLVVVKNAQLKHQDVELVVSAEFIGLQDITESIVDDDTRTCCEFESKAPVFFCKVDDENLCSQVGQCDCNSSMRALYTADPLARDLPEIWQKSPENVRRLCNNFSSFRVRATECR